MSMHGGAPCTSPKMTSFELASAPSSIFDVRWPKLPGRKLSIVERKNGASEAAAADSQAETSENAAIAAAVEAATAAAAVVATAVEVVTVVRRATNRARLRRPIVLVARIIKIGDTAQRRVDDPTSASGLI